MIVDCHSFPSKPFIRDLDQSTNRPDFNIGTDPFHTPKELIELSKEFFQNKGYSLGIDWPYSGSLVPMSHYHKTKEVQSIMLEVNRALYLDEPSNEKSRGYAGIKETVREYLALIRKKQK
jgi:N-formylglutamate amidohydrolase